ncbi:helix-turn-helix transcriptional regulator [Sphingomonas sp. ID1715]|uniref:helix-turn-helix transcriptional regulator n=1 Tax=Sphingomonas sp. ID1715 TaxID=1656898 RepID=UPI001C2BFBCC|nr:helix-turn-helix transcriptional regulator [Sphingomonas sp. ID1715]
MGGRSFEQLIDDIYEVPLGAAGWKALAPALQDHLGAPVAMFLAHGADVRVLGDAGPVSGAGMLDYADHLWRDDRGMSALRSAPAGEIIVDSSLISDPERRRSGFYNDLLGAHGLDRGLYASIASGSEGMMFMAAQRSARQGDYDLSEIQALRRLLPHLRRSYRTWLHVREAERQRGAVLQAADAMAVGVALVDQDGRLRYANHAAEREMSRGTLLVTNGRLTCRSPSSAKVLGGAIRAATRDKLPAGERLCLRPLEQGATYLSVLVVPVRDALDPGWRPDSLAMLLISPSEPPAASEGSLLQTYGLTAAEARLLAALVGGERLPDYARRCGIAVTTAKTHLRALFDKIGERRQSDLIRRASLDPLLRAAPAKTRIGAPPR